MTPEEAVTFAQCAATQTLEVARMVEQPSAAASTPIQWPMTEPHIQAAPASITTPAEADLPCPARVPAAIKARVPPAPLSPPP